ncbi:hypothetical protein Athai_06090 [Actinocatenispora thailandica]|uniref:Uncharacterized protein n=1 Tax=Actinocatenispora thailandica TaxID=227318 RepID=A0A7R7DKF5_9ACTN|nr:hypothetical protein [Actinocatenispora thailandica]BCJ33106.1 hypothetical protein Athai_06090 [Actinocatenispora thailandica]
MTNSGKTNYGGSGPYCYANSLAMVLGDAAPPAGTIEVLTGSPFGFELLGGTMPLFDPYGWDPETGLDAATAALGWRCEYSNGGDPGTADPDEAWRRLRAALTQGPAIAGALDMGRLLFQPGTPTDEGIDHYVVVLEADDEQVLLHDPHGHPYATLDRAAFLTAWRGERVPYLAASYVLRSAFAAVRPSTVDDAVRSTLPAAAAWLRGRDDRPVPPGTLANAAGLATLAERADAGLSDAVRDHLAYFAIRVGARRLADAARCLRALGLDAAAEIATGQARLVGALQHPMVRRDDAAVAALLRRLAPSYHRLAAALPR